MQRPCISVLSFGKCHCSSACLASEGVEGGASAPCPHPRAAEGFVCWGAVSGAGSASRRRHRQDGDRLPAHHVRVLPAFPLPPQAGGFDSHPWGVKGWVHSRVTQSIGAAGAVPRAQLDSSPLARLGSGCCSGHSAYPGGTLPDSQHTPGWGQHRPCLL